MLGYVIVLLADGRLKRVCRDTVSLHASSDLPAERRSLPEPLYLANSSELTCFPNPNPPLKSQSPSSHQNSQKTKKKKKWTQGIACKLQITLPLPIHNYLPIRTYPFFKLFHYLILPGIRFGCIRRKKLILIGRTN